MSGPRLIGALAVCCGLAAGEASADPSASRTITNAFETVVVKPATEAAGAAKTAIDKKLTPKESGKEQTKAPAPAAAGTPADPKAAPDPKDTKTEAAKPDAKKPPVPTEWPATEVELARARCTQILKGLDAEAVLEAPFRNGDCGAPAPVRLISIGRNPAVTFDPPALVTCDMVQALDTWIKTDIQRLARKHLGTPVTKIASMSDYSCRNAYGRVANKLSEHGRANALDIRGFETKTGEMAAVLTGWGPTQRDIKKQLAALKAAADKADAVKAEAERVEAERRAADARAKPPAPAGPADTSTTTALPKSTIVDGQRKLTITLPGQRSPGATPGSEGLSVAEPAHLGGPNDAKSKDAKAQDAKPKDAKAKGKEKSPPAGAGAAKPSPETASLPPGSETQLLKPATHATALFLHGIHDGACRIFGTTLGPEANEAHRNHLHVDMAPRAIKKICD